MRSSGRWRSSSLTILIATVVVFLCQLIVCRAHLFSNAGRRAAPLVPSTTSSSMPQVEGRGGGWRSKMMGMIKATPAVSPTIEPAVRKRGSWGQVAADNQEDKKWDTGKFLKAVVDAQVDQVRWEVNRVKSFIPPGIIKVNRRPAEVVEQLGKLSVDVAFGYAQSAALGYVFGFGGYLMADEMTKKVTTRFFGKRAAHVRGLKQAKQFGEFCAAFTFFEGALLVVRGVNDKWNAVLGSTAVGMYTMRKRSLNAQLKNGLTFGGFNYLLMGFAGDPTKKAADEAKVGGSPTGVEATKKAVKKGGGRKVKSRKDEAEVELSRGRSILKDATRRR